MFNINLSQCFILAKLVYFVSKIGIMLVKLVAHFGNNGSTLVKTMA